MEIQSPPGSLDAIRDRIKQMSDAQLLRYGQSAKYMCSAWANRGEPARPEFLIQLEEARAEWRRRYPKEPLVDSI